MTADGLKSLLELLQVNAPFYVRIGQMYEDYLHGARAVMSPPDAPLNQVQYDAMLTPLRDLHRECAGMHLVVSASVLQSTITAFEQQVPKFKESQQGVESWFRCFNAELETQVFFVVLPHRIPYLFTIKDGIGFSLVNAAKDFRDALYDAHEAGHCFACGRFSASVYHLMRLTEHGLVSVAASLNVPQDKISKGWDGCIQGIESAIKVISSTKPTTDWQDQVKKYSDLCSWFTTIKTGWRNPSSHVPRIYSESSASGMFSAALTLFEHLNRYGFQQTLMPLDPLQFPQE